MTTTPLPPQPAATYTLTIVADSGYESTMEGQCDAEQYALAVKALHEPAAARADLEAENERLRDAIDAIYIYASDTLSGRTDGPDDREWQRAAVLEIRNRARKYATVDSAVLARAALETRA